MPAFMIGGIALFLVGKHETATFTTHENLVLGIFKVAHVQLFLIQLGSLQSGFIDQVFQIRAGKARRAACQHLQVHIGSQRRALGMHLKNALAAPQIRRRHHHLTVKATGPQQGGIKHVGTVGGRNEDDALVAFKAVHFHQQLIQGLFAFVVSAAQPSAALAAHGVDFVNKNQTGGVLLALNKEIAHAGRAHAHEHFHKVGTGDGEKRHTGFSGHGPGKQGLTCTGRPHKQHALGNAPAQPGKLLGIGKKFDDFGKFVLGFVHTGHVVKGDAAVFLIEHAGPRTAKVHGLAAAPALHLTHEENPHSNQQRHGQQGNKHLHVPGLLFRRLCLDLHLLFHQAGDQFQIAGGVASDRGAVRGFPRQGIALNGDAGNLPAVHAGNKVGIGQLLRRALRLLKHIEHHNQSNGDDAPQQQVSAGLIQDGLPQRLRYPVTFPGERNFSLETSPQRGALSICPYCRSSEHKHAPASGNGRSGISPGKQDKKEAPGYEGLPGSAHADAERGRRARRSRQASAVIRGGAILSPSALSRRMGRRFFRRLSDTPAGQKGFPAGQRNKRCILAGETAPDEAEQPARAQPQGHGDAEKVQGKGCQRGTGAQRGLIHGEEDGREHKHIGGDPYNAGPQRALEGIRNCGAGGLDGNGCGCGHGSSFHSARFTFFKIETLWFLSRGDEAGGAPASSGLPQRRGATS